MIPGCGQVPLLTEEEMDVDTEKRQRARRRGGPAFCGGGGITDTRDLVIGENADVVSTREDMRSSCLCNFHSTTRDGLGPRW